MRSLRDTPIKSKMMFVILLTCSVVLFLACAVLFVFQVGTIKRGFVRDLSSLAEIVARNSTAAVAFNDKEAAEETLKALRARPDIVSAAIILPDGSPFAVFGEGAEIAGMRRRPIDHGFRFENNRVLTAGKIVLENKRLGTLYLCAEFRTAYIALSRLYGEILALVLAASLVVAFLLSSGLQRFISEPILKLARTAQFIAEKNDYSVRAETLGRDEVGLFTSAFNKMLERIQAQDTALQSAHEAMAGKVEALRHEISERNKAEAELRISQEKLLEASRRAGMAEVATGVLHNVGNVLNSVNVSATLIAERVGKSSSQNLGKVAALLRENEAGLGAYLTSDPRGMKVPGFLIKLADVVAREQEELRGEIDLLNKNIIHIKDIVAMQQSYAKVSGVIESLPVASLVDDAISMNTAAFRRHGVEIVRRFDDAPNVPVDRHRVLQILTNLLRNAKYALDDTGRAGDKRINVDVNYGQNGHVDIVVADNGIGIDPANLTKIFSHGFTTKSEGHGFGLHSSANAAREMGGSLRAESEGLGRGATFVLELPVGKAAS